MTHEEFIEQECRLCGSQRCYGEEYCGKYQKMVNGENLTSAHPMQLMMSAARQQIILRKLSENNKSTSESTPHWIKVSIDPDKARWKCSSCGKETDLPNYDQANFCFNCGEKMIGDKTND